MPLLWRDLRPAERLTLPLYPTVFGIIGATFLLQSPSRTSSPAFDIAKWLLPIQLWSLIFLAIAAVEAVVLFLQLSHRVYIRALEVGAGLVAFWAVLLLASALQSDQVSFTGPQWLLVPIVGQVASARGLATRTWKGGR